MTNIKDICPLEMARRDFEYACWRSMWNDQLRRDKAHKRGAFSEKTEYILLVPKQLLVACNGK